MGQDNAGRQPYYFPKILQIQLVKELKREKTFPQGAEIRKASSWLAEMPYP